MLSENWELRAKARQQLSGNWGMPILVCFLYFLISITASGFPICGGVVGLLLGGPLLYGLTLYMLKFIRLEKPPLEVMFEGFNNFGPPLALYLWRLLWIMLWLLVLIIPGIIKALSYSMAFYIMADQPQIKAGAALKLSMAITQGYKGKIFLLGLSFLGWGLLAILTLGIGFIWLMPYIQVSFANLFLNLKAEAGSTGRYPGPPPLPASLNYPGY